MELPIIKTKTDLENLYEYLYKQGFGYLDKYNAHKHKIISIIHKNNTLDIKYDSNLIDNMYKLDNYNDVEEKVKEYFSKFSSDDKIFELLNHLYLVEDDSCSVPSKNYPNSNEIIKWFNFRKKYNIKEFKNTNGFFNNIHYYNLDKNILKIKYSDEYNFKKLYYLIFNENIESLEKKYGVWLQCGKLEIKLYLNGYANIKGDIDKLKDYYYRYVLKIKENKIIRYKGKQEVMYRNDD